MHRLGRCAAALALAFVVTLPVENAHSQGAQDPTMDYVIRFEAGTLNEARSGNKDRLFFYSFGFRAQFDVDGSTTVRVTEHDGLIRVKEGDDFDIPGEMGSKAFLRVPHFRSGQSPRVTAIGSVVLGIEGRGCTRNSLHKKVIQPARAALEDAIAAIVADRPVPFNGGAEAWFAAISTDLMALSGTFSQRIRTREIVGGCLGAALVPGVKKPVLTGFHIVLVLPTDHPVSSYVEGMRRDFEAPRHPALTIKVVEYDEEPARFPIGPVRFTGDGEMDLEISGSIGRLDLSPFLPPGIAVTTE